MDFKNPETIKKIKHLRKTMTLNEVGATFDVSGEWVRQVIKGRPDSKVLWRKTFKQYSKEVNKIIKNPLRLKKELARLSKHDRHRDVVLQRAIFVHHLRLKKVKFRDIAKTLKRDISSVTNLLKQYGKYNRDLFGG